SAAPRHGPTENRREAYRSSSELAGPGAAGPAAVERAGGPRLDEPADEASDAGWDGGRAPAGPWNPLGGRRRSRRRKLGTSRSGALVRLATSDRAATVGVASRRVGPAAGASAAVDSAGPPAERGPSAACPVTPLAADVSMSLLASSAARRTRGRLALRSASAM